MIQLTMQVFVKELCFSSNRFKESGWNLLETGASNLFRDLCGKYIITIFRAYFFRIVKKDEKQNATK